MAFMGLNPEKARTLSSVMRQTGAAADSLSSEVNAALSLSQLDSELPGQLVFSGEELEQLGVIIAARVDIAEGFVIDPATLSADAGITVAQAEAAIAAFAVPESNPKELTPFLDALAANKQAAEVLRSSFTNLPSLGSDPAVDQTLLRLGTWLPGALETGKLPVLTEEQILDLRVLTDGLELDSGEILAGFDFVRIAEPQLGASEAPASAINGFGSAREIGGIAGVIAGGFASGARVDASSLVTAAGSAFSADTLIEISNALFSKISGAFDQDAKLKSAAGLPSVADLYKQHQIDIDHFDVPFDTRFEALDEWLPAYLAGELKEPPNLDDPTTRQLLVDLAAAVSTGGSISAVYKRFKVAAVDQAGTGELHAEAALKLLRGGRYLQKALISGDFESIDGPVIVWSENGLETALLAGRRQGVVTEQTEGVSTIIAENVLTNPDGSDIPIDLSEEQQQALVAAIVTQNGEEFVVDSPSIQRQLVSAVNLIRQQTTLADQRIVFAKVIEGFRSLAVVGSPAVTWTQLKEVVGEKVADELGHNRLASRSTEATNRRPQFISLLSHWGIPGGDTIKLKKRKFSFRFDELGRLTEVRNKKLSKWKRFKNSVKAFGKALWNDWSDNPWKYLFMGPAGLLPGANQVAEGFEDGDFGDIAEGTYEMTKFAATIAATVFPATTAAGVAAMSVLAADTVYQASQGNWLGAASSAFGAVGGAAGFFGDVGAVGSTANIISKGAAVGKGVVTAIDVGDDFVAAIEDGDIFAALGSGFALAGSAASVVASGSELANGIGQRLSGNPIVNTGLLDKVIGSNPLVSKQLLEQTFTNPIVSSGTIDLIGEFGQTAADLGAITTGVESTLSAIENDDIAGALTSGFATLGRGAVAVGSPDGIIDNAFSPGALNTIGEFGTSAVQLAGVAAQTGATIEAVEQGNLAGAITGGISVVGQGINAVTDDRGIIDDGLGTSEGLEGKIRAGGVSLTEFGSVVESGFATAEAVENGDIAGALSNGFGLTGEAAALAGNQQGIVPGLVGLDAADLVALNQFSNSTAVKLTEAAQIGGAVFDGDALGVLENGVDFLRVDAEDGSRFEGQLNVADEGLELGRVVEGVARGGEVPDFETILGQLGDLKTAVERVPEAPPEVSTSDSSLLGRDEDGNPWFAAGAPLSTPAAPVKRGLTIDDPVVQNGAGLAAQGAAPESVTVGDGQSLSEIAEDFGVSVDDLLAANAEITDRDSIQIGQRITLPDGTQPTFHPSPARPGDLVEPPTFNPSPPRPADFVEQPIEEDGLIGPRLPASESLENGASGPADTPQVETGGGFGDNPGLSVGVSAEAQFLGQSADGAVATGSFIGGTLSKQIGDDVTTEVSGGSLTQGKVNDFVSVEVKDGDKTRVTTGENKVRTEQVDFTEVKGRLGADEPFGESIDASGKRKDSGGRRVTFGLGASGSIGRVDISEETVNADGTVLRGEGTGTEASVGVKADAGLDADATFAGREFEVEAQVGAGVNFDKKSSELTSRLDGDPDTVVVVNEEAETVSLGLEARISGAVKPVEGALSNASSAKAGFNVSIPVDETRSRSTVTLTNGEVDREVIEESRSGFVANTGSRTTTDFENGREASLSRIDQSNGLLSEERETLREEFNVDGSSSGTRVQDDDGIFADTTGLVEFERDADGNIEGSIEIEVDDGIFSDTTIETVTERLPDGSLKETETKITENLFSDPTVETTETITPNVDIDPDLGG